LSIVLEFCQSPLTAGRADAEEPQAARIDYLEELLSLVEAFRDESAAEPLRRLAQRFKDLPELALSVRLAVLNTLVGLPPPPRPEFWREVLEQEPAFAAPVLSGLLATAPLEAVALLPQLPDAADLADACVIKLDVAWEQMVPPHRSALVASVEAILGQLGTAFALPVRAWVEGKSPARLPANTGNLGGLERALERVLHGEHRPLHRDSRLLSPALAA
jgi:hypothetical protein